MTRADAFIIGGGPAGASAAVWLAAAGWKVVLVEQSPFPGQKVCGECLPAGAFPLLDELGVGDQVRRLAGPELERIGWMHADTFVLGRMPACKATADPYGRAIGRDVLDSLLMDRARAAGVEVRQPARVVAVHGAPGRFFCDLVARDGDIAPERVAAAVVIDAHGSWQRGPRMDFDGGPTDPADAPSRPSDLLAFKATFTRSSLASGVLPLIALPGGYGGMVVSGGGRTTVAVCLRRDALQLVRARYRGMAAGPAVEAHLRDSCRAAARTLEGAPREGRWLAVGPLRPGARPAIVRGVHRIGNAAAEAHPLVGEGMRMALLSARSLARSLAAPTRAPRPLTRAGTATRPRLHTAACLAHINMRPLLAAAAGRLLRLRPALLTSAARLAGKAAVQPIPAVIEEQA